MSVVERVLLVVNQAAGLGHDRSVAENLRRMLVETLDRRVTVRVEVVGDHPEARKHAAAFLTASEVPALIVAGGGGGTLRAVIEGLCEGGEAGDLPGRERMRVAALRMGSGNVLSRQFGVPRNPETALKGILQNLQADRTAPCCVMRCEVGTRDGCPEVHHAVTLGGFGQLGRVPGDLARWHHRLRRSRAIAAKLLGIETLTNLEYALALVVRSVSCALMGVSSVEVIEVCSQDGEEVLPLLAGAVMNFPLDALPIAANVRVEDEALELYLIPHSSRLSALRLILAPRRLLQSATYIRLEKDGCVKIRLCGRNAAEFFLDEDPMVFHGHLTLRVAGSLAFVPGPEYSYPTGGAL